MGRTFGDLVNNVLPEGQYHLVIDDVEETTSGQGNPMLRFQATVTKGDYRNRKVFWNRSLVEKALFRLIKDFLSLRIVSPTDEAPDRPEDYASIALKMRRRAGVANVTVTEGNNGGRFNDVTFIAAEGDGPELVTTSRGPARVSSDDI